MKLFLNIFGEIRTQNPNLRMFEKNQNPILELKEINNKECLYFTFRGVFTQNDAESAILEWKQLIDSKKGEKVNIVWQCLEMENYDANARVLWQKAIKELKDSIDMIWLITDSVLIQAGAEMISFFTSYHINIVKSKEELNQRISDQKINLA